MFTWRFIRVWQRNRDVFFSLWHSEVPGLVIEPVIVLLAMGLGMGVYVGLVDGRQYIVFVAPGIIAGYAMFSAAFECTYGSFSRMKFQKTFDAIIATPLSAEDVIAGEIFWGATRAALTGTIVLIIALAFQLVSSPWAVLIPVLTFIEGLMFSSIALFYTSLVPSIYSFNYFFTLFITPLFFFSGVYFPLAAFPEIIQRLSFIAPLTPAVELSRALVNGEFHPGLLLDIGIIVAIILLFFWLSLKFMKRRLTA